MQCLCLTMCTALKKKTQMRLREWMFLHTFLHISLQIRTQISRVKVLDEFGVSYTVPVIKQNVCDYIVNLSQ